MKIRIFELAERLGKDATEVREEIKRRGKVVHSNLSLVEDSMFEELSAFYSGKAPAGEAAPKASKPKAAAPKVKAVPKAEPELAPVAEKVEQPKEADVAKAAPSKFAIPKKKAKITTKPVEAEPVAALPSEAPVPVEGGGAEKPAEGSEPTPPKPARALTSVSMEIPRRDRSRVVIIDTPPPRERRSAADRGISPTARPIAGPRGVAVAGAGVVTPPPVSPGINAASIVTSSSSGSKVKPTAANTKPTRPKKKGAYKKDKKREAIELVPTPVTTEMTSLVKPGEPLKPLALPEGSSISEMAQAMGIKASEMIKRLMVEYKVMATVNQKLPNDVVETLALDYGFEVQHEGLYGQEMLGAQADDPTKLMLRAPVVTIMGHVDHGKTTLLDAIRDTKVAAGESGGITQHIGAYKVHLPQHEGFPGGDVVFLDTPGHAAFTAMRARGAKATDIVVLVVAADDSVMPQTIEAIDHAKAAGVPIMVAINKIDKEGANPDRVMQELGQHGLMPEAWGGSTIMVKMSAKKREGVTELLEMLALQAQVMEMKADPSRRAIGVVIEAKLDKGRGPVATVLVQKGTLKVGDTVLVGNHVGRVRALINDLGKKLEEAGPSTPVELLGLSGVPVAGDEVLAVEDEKLARQIASKRQQVQQDRDRANRGHVRLEDLFDRIQAGDMKELNIVIKADMSGSVEALRGTLEDIKSDKVRARVIHGGVGNINESDVILAAASDALIIGFHVKTAPGSVELSQKEGVQVRLYDVIYQAVDDVRGAMLGLLAPVVREIQLGKGEVKQIFKLPRGFIVGSMVTGGKVTRDAILRFSREGEKVWEGKALGLKRFKDDAREVVEGQECGIALDASCGIKEGDTFEAIGREEVAQKL